MYVLGTRIMFSLFFFLLSFFLPCPGSSAATGAVRLVGGAHEREGILEVFLNLRWGVVCGDNWRQQGSGFNHRTVCAQLGFDGGDVRYLNSTRYVYYIHVCVYLFRHT